MPAVSGFECFLTISFAKVIACSLLVNQSLDILFLNHKNFSDRRITHAPGSVISWPSVIKSARLFESTVTFSIVSCSFLVLEAGAKTPRFVVLYNYRAMFANQFHLILYHRLPKLFPGCVPDSNSFLSDVNVPEVTVLTRSDRVWMFRERLENPLL